MPDVPVDLKPESIVEGLFIGMGIDTALWGAAYYFPQLRESSGLPIPPYDPVGIHYNDLIALGSSVAVIGVGAATRNMNTAVKGVGMAIGNVIASQLQNLAHFTQQESSSLDLATMKTTAASRDSLTPGFIF